jgi:large subunit ribosomal protein MRP49
MLRQDALLALDCPLFYLGIEDLPQLYESWCALQVLQAVLALGVEVHEQDLVHIDGDGMHLVTSVRLPDDSPMLAGVLGDVQLRVRYQARYRAGTGIGVQLGSLDNHLRVPDVVVECQRGDRIVVAVLDAKYRLDAAGISVPPDALADAYAYHGAIGYGGRPVSCGVLLLYPGSSAPEWYPSGVGALALLPGVGSTELANWLRGRLVSLE